MVAGRHLDGGDDVWSGYAASRDGNRLSIWNSGKLAVVVNGAQRNADRLFLCTLVATCGRADRYGICRVEICRKTSGVLAGISRALPGAAGEYDHHGLGKPGHGENP